jgi:hypothetical protein
MALTDPKVRNAKTKEKAYPFVDEKGGGLTGQQERCEILVV